MQFNQDIQKAAEINFTTWWYPDMEMDAKGLFLIRVSKKCFSSRLVGLQNVLKWPPKKFPKKSLEAENFKAQYLKMKNDIVPSFWTEKYFLVKTFAQFSQQIRRILKTKMNFWEKIKFILALLPTFPNTQ